MNPLTQMLTSPGGIAQLVCFGLLFLALLVVLEIRARTSRDGKLRQLHAKCDLAVGLLTRQFHHLDWNRDGVITRADLDEALKHGHLSAELVDVAQLIRYEVETLGSLIDTALVPVGVGGMEPSCAVFEEYGIRRADVPLLKARLEAAIRRLGRKPYLQETV